tara:strand:+ start:167292 stop:167924 length:633 start_codon:yes stop_codon:yes gene_type:complete
MSQNTSDSADSDPVGPAKGAGPLDQDTAQPQVSAQSELDEMADSTEQFVQHIAEHQNRLFSYVFSMLADHTRASDVLQETNLVLWRKRDEFQEGQPFLPWAFAIARFQVLANIRDRKRERCLLDSDLVEMLARSAEVEADAFEETRIALRECLSDLTPKNRELVRDRYFRAMPINQLAETLGRGSSAIKVALLRIRRQLAECVTQRVSKA